MVAHLPLAQQHGDGAAPNLTTPGFQPSPIRDQLLAVVKALEKAWPGAGIVLFVVMDTPAGQRANYTANLTRLSAMTAVRGWLERQDAQRYEGDPLPAATSDVLADVTCERARQIAKGYAAEHDDKHQAGEIALAAACYAIEAARISDGWKGSGGAPPWWPWSDDAWNPGNRRRGLVKATAMLLAEIERLDRTAEAAG